MKSRNNASPEPSISVCGKRKVGNDVHEEDSHKKEEAHGDQRSGSVSKSRDAHQAQTSNDATVTSDVDRQNSSSSNNNNNTSTSTSTSSTATISTSSISSTSRSPTTSPPTVQTAGGLLCPIQTGGGGAGGFLQEEGGTPGVLDKQKKYADAAKSLQQAHQKSAGHAQEVEKAEEEERRWSGEAQKFTKKAKAWREESVACWGPEKEAKVKHDRWKRQMELDRAVESERELNEERPLSPQRKRLRRALEVVDEAEGRLAGLRGRIAAEPRRDLTSMYLNRLRGTPSKPYIPKMMREKTSVFDFVEPTNPVVTSARREAEEVEMDLGMARQVAQEQQVEMHQRENDHESATNKRKMAEREIEKLEASSSSAKERSNTAMENSKRCDQDATVASNKRRKVEAAMEGLRRQSQDAIAHEEACQIAVTDARIAHLEAVRRAAQLVTPEEEEKDQETFSPRQQPVKQQQQQQQQQKEEEGASDRAKGA